MSGAKRIQSPLDRSTAKALTIGTKVFLSGEVFGARDQAHIRMLESLARGEPLPFDPRGAVIYYVGPTPGSQGRPVGASGPTTSARMDAMLEPLLQAGVLATIGKGPRGPEAKSAMKRFGAVYFVATGGAGAFLGTKVERADILAYEDLGPEALRRFVVRDLPLIVAVDAQGRDLFEEGPAQFRSDGHVR